MNCAIVYLLFSATEDTEFTEWIEYILRLRHSCECRNPVNKTTPYKEFCCQLDSRLRGNDGKEFDRTVSHTLTSEFSVSSVAL